MTKKQSKSGNTSLPVTQVDEQPVSKQKLTKLERIARKEMRQSIRVAAYGGDYGNMGGGNIKAGDSSFYSPQLSTDFLELPQSEREKRELFRFWYNCFVPGTPVLLSDGTTQSIESVTVGSKVLNALGEETEVINTFKADIQDTIYELEVRGIQGSIQATGNHPFYVYRAEKIDCKYTHLGACKSGSQSICKRTNCSGKDLGEPAFVNSMDLREGDFIVSPHHSELKDSGLNRDQLRLLGYFAAEGSLAYRSAGKVRGIEYSLNIDEFDTIASEIKESFNRLYGKNARAYKEESRNTTKVVCDSLEFVELCLKHVGTGSSTKRLSSEIVNSLPEQALEFLGAYWNGDGCLTDNSYTANSVSDALASQIYCMLRNVGIPAYILKYDPNGYGKRLVGLVKTSSKPVNNVSFPGRYYDSFKKFANYVNGAYTATNTRVYIVDSKYGFLHRIEKITQKSYDGPIYNFEVKGEGDRKSYVAHYLATHNTHPIVGAAIDFHCFPAGAPVMLKNGTVRPIEHLMVGDEVVNGLGEHTQVINTFKHDINDQIVRLKVRGVQSTIDSTLNHPFLVYRKEKIDCKYPKHGMGACKSGSKFLCKQKKCEGLDFGEPEFIFAKDLKEGDYICSPSMQSSKSVFTKSQLRLLGYYAAEGSLSRTKNGALDRVSFVLNVNEWDMIAQEIMGLFNSEYSHEAKRYLRKDDNACEILCYKKDFAELCYEHVGSGSRQKILSQEIVDSPREDILEFLGAYWNSDGSLTKNGLVATITSKDLAHQVYALALKVGYSPTIHEHFPKEGTGLKFAGAVYKIIIPYRYFNEFSRYANHLGNGYTVGNTREYTIQIGKNTLRRIEKMDVLPYIGTVYNIEVDGEGDRKSYVAYGLATHNTDVPMSKLRLSLPKGKDVKRNKQILHYYQEMCSRVQLFQTLYDATHEYWLNGNVYMFCEDHDLSEEIPEDLLSVEENEEVGEIDYAGRALKKSVSKRVLMPESVRSQNIRKYVQDNYKGWQRIQILPPEQIKLETFQYTNRVRMELIPSEKDRLLVLKASEGNDAESSKIADDIPDQIKENLLSGQPIPLNTSPYDDFLCSSFCYHLSHKKAAYDDRGISLLERCLRTLVFQDKLRQAQTSIASRAMTPKRVVWADKMSEPDTDALRDQIDQAIIDPDFTVVTNFEVHWDEIGSRDRLLDLSTEYEITNKMLYIGLRITESMLTGESSFSGEKIHLDVMNTMYLLYRERMSEFVEEKLFKPVAEKKGFYEEDEYGNRQLLYPKLQFTRLALRDNSELQDYMFNLYQKGSLPISFILDLLNIDSDDALEQLKRDMFTPNDSTFNEFLKGVLTKAGDEAVEKTDVLDKIIENAGLRRIDKKSDRFGKEE
jgi:intein/homing endonuclease